MVVTGFFAQCEVSCQSFIYRHDQVLVQDMRPLQIIVCLALIILAFVMNSANNTKLTGAESLGIYNRCVSCARFAIFLVSSVLFMHKSSPFCGAYINCDRYFFPEHLT